MTKFGAAERYSDLQRPLAASHTFFPNHCRQRALDGQSVLTQAPFARWTAHDRADSCAIALSPAGIGGQCSKTYSQRTCSLRPVHQNGDLTLSTVEQVADRVLALAAG